MGGLASLAVVGGLVYVAIVRPRIRRWGATDEEVLKALPGDDIPSPTGYRPVSTRAITIDAPPDEVWPWLVQMGSGRAGFYTHEWVERLLFITYAEGHSATHIHEEWQELHVGDRVPYSRLNTVPVTLIERPRCLIAGEWLVLEPLESGTRTRLIARTRGGWLEPLARKVPIFWPLLWPMAALIDRGPGELFHYYMERGMLTGIKSRVEAARAGMGQPSVCATTHRHGLTSRYPRVFDFVVRAFRWALRVQRFSRTKSLPTMSLHVCDRMKHEDALSRYT